MNRKRVIITSLILGVVISIIWIGVGEILDNFLNGALTWFIFPILIALVLPFIFLRKNSNSKSKAIDYFVFLGMYVVGYLSVVASVLTAAGGP